MKSPALRKKPKISDDPAELRRRAELRLSGHQTKTAPNQTDADNERQFRELEVHQIELEMQIPCLSAWICARPINRDERP
jgi:hypothetical protein